MLEFLFNKVLKVCNFIKKGLNIAKFVRAAFSIEHLWWLLLSNHAAFDNQKNKANEILSNKLKNTIPKRKLKNCENCEGFIIFMILLRILYITYLIRTYLHNIHITERRR